MELQKDKTLTWYKRSNYPYIIGRIIYFFAFIWMIYVDYGYHSRDPMDLAGSLIVIPLIFFSFLEIIFIMIFRWRKNRSFRISLILLEIVITITIFCLGNYIINNIWNTYDKLSHEVRLIFYTFSILGIISIGKLMLVPVFNRIESAKNNKKIDDLDKLRIYFLVYAITYGFIGLDLIYFGFSHVSLFYYAQYSIINLDNLYSPFLAFFLIRIILPSIIINWITHLISFNKLSRRDISENLRIKLMENNFDFGIFQKKIRLLKNLIIFVGIAKILLVLAISLSTLYVLNFILNLIFLSYLYKNQKILLNINSKFYTIYSDDSHEKFDSKQLIKFGWLFCQIGYFGSIFVYFFNFLSINNIHIVCFILDILVRISSVIGLTLYCLTYMRISKKMHYLNLEIIS